MKLQAKDLRVGNRALRCGYLHEERNKFHEIVVSHHDITACFISPESFQPIPLTEEWLRRVDWKGYKPMHINSNFSIDEYGHLYYRSDYTGINLLYVHSLQNAYHLIRGEEIEFNQTINQYGKN